MMSNNNSVEPQNSVESENYQGGRIYSAIREILHPLRRWRDTSPRIQGEKGLLCRFTQEIYG
jgi:hypothetical protein